MYKHIDTIYICNVFPVAIEYGDYSGLTDQDIEQLEEWLKLYTANNLLFEYGEETSFETCDITGLKADCTECSVYEWSEENE